MFDRYADAFLTGQFQITIDSHENADGSFKSSYTAPNGTTIEATAPTRSDAHRQVTDKVREGVMNQSIQLGR